MRVRKIKQLMPKPLRSELAGQAFIPGLCASEVHFVAAQLIIMLTFKYY